jgi:hypothetical protein
MTIIRLKGCSPPMASRWGTPLIKPAARAPRRLIKKGRPAGAPSICDVANRSNAAQCLLDVGLRSMPELIWKADSSSRLQRKCRDPMVMSPWRGPRRRFNAGRVGGPETTPSPTAAPGFTGSAGAMLSSSENPVSSARQVVTSSHETKETGVAGKPNARRRRGRMTRYRHATYRCRMPKGLRCCRAMRSSRRLPTASPRICSPTWQAAFAATPERHSIANTHGPALCEQDSPHGTKLPTDRPLHPPFSFFQTECPRGPKTARQEIWASGMIGPGARPRLARAPASGCVSPFGLSGGLCARPAA